MAKSPIKPRRPVGWNTLLRKGHVHERSRSADRSDERRRLEDEVDAYLSDTEGDDAAAPGPGEKKRSTDGDPADREVPATVDQRDPE